MELFRPFKLFSYGNVLNKEARLRGIELSIALFFTLFPLLFNLPYRDNLYLSWEGTYRLYIGQLPYKDYGMPIGYGYFLIPLLLFKIFGPFLRTLLYAQVLINLISLWFFRGIFKRLGLNRTEVVLTVLVFIVSYTFSFFWPWYNNTAFMFELGAFYFILNIPTERNWKYYSCLLLAGLFSFLSFFTKQDYGGITFIFCSAVLIYAGYHIRDYRRIGWFVAANILFAGIFIYPFIKSDFLYWFNYGQSPHQSRINSGHFVTEFMANSPWEKFYIVLILLLFIERWKGIKEFLSNRNEVLFFLISFGIVVQNLITKVTSRLPLESTTYFHAFAFSYIISHLKLQNFFKKKYSLVIAVCLIFLWWSAIYWKYANRIFHFSENSITENKVSDNEFVGEPWKSAPFNVYKGINLPVSTINGIQRIKRLALFQKSDQLKILNMSELTPLAYELNFVPQRQLPLWYHLNIGMFEKQVQEINQKIIRKEFDMVLFEVVPGLDNFYPFAVRKQLLKDYARIDSFMAPRKAGDSHIEVFIKK